MKEKLYLKATSILEFANSSNVFFILGEEFYAS